MCRRFQGLVRTFLVFLLGSLAAPLTADTVFIEAETMKSSSDGWQAVSNDQTQRASRLKTLWGANGAGDSVASQGVAIQRAGRHKIWVRYMQVAAWRGAFQVSVAKDGRKLATRDFDREVITNVPDWEYTWQGFSSDLPAGDVTITVEKFEHKNCTGYVRHIDCLLVTDDDKLVPDHEPYAPQTLVRVTMGAGYERPVYLHLFSDHYRHPWYAHYALGRDGLHAALAPPAGQFLNSGETTPWCNLTSTIYQDSGAALNFSVRHSYHEKAKKFVAKLEFARADSGLSLLNGAVPKVVKTFDITAEPNGLVIIAPPDLESPLNIARLKRDAEFAEEVGQLADRFPWPTHGRRPTRIPFWVTASIGGYDLPVDAAVTRREEKTLDYFGFNGTSKLMLPGLWHMKDGSYCQPDLDAMRRHALHDLELFQKSGRKVDDVPFIMLMDEPTGQATDFMVKDQGYQSRFRSWLKAKSVGPQDVNAKDWDSIKPVLEADRNKFPELYYYTQLFRTRALGDFMGSQRKIQEEVYGRTFPTLVNFSDGAVYHANFCGQGVDYFELLDDDNQNAIWGEDWANNSSTYQCAAYNVALMQAAARKRKQTIGHYLIAHANRTSWDIKTKAVGETARGVRIWKNFSYGPTWSSHEGGATWQSHLWHRKPDLWLANAEITREIGAVEDWLLTASPARADVALLYSSSSDIWTMQSNLAFGFDRMHTWLALTHAQIPVDIVPEREFDRLDQYKVCYLSGPNLTRAATAKLRDWLSKGGVLWLTAGAAQRDEFNRPLDLLGNLTSVVRSDMTEPAPYESAGKFLSYLNALDTVSWNGEALEVLSVKQPLTLGKTALPKEPGLKPDPGRDPSTDAAPQVLATFKDGQPAAVVQDVGRGKVFMLGFLPALSYIKPALIARRPTEQQVDAERIAARQLASAANQPLATSAALVTTPESTNGNSDQELVKRSHNPWSYPAGIRERILTPIQTAAVTPDLTCGTPLVDAVALPCAQGTLIALSNHTLQPQARVQFTLRIRQQVTQIESVRKGTIKIENSEPGSVRFALLLDASDFVMVHHASK